MYNILIVEDDALLNKTLCFNLNLEGYETESASTCGQARDLLAKEMFHLALLDINLPDGNGLDLCGEIRESNPDTYILFLTANDKESDMFRGYEAGGTDYITKPFSVAVLCKKIAAIFSYMKQQNVQHDRYDDGALILDFSEQSATLNGEPVDFTPKEYRTLLIFVKNPRLILTKQLLLEKLWDNNGEFVDEHTLTTVISRIRKKIEIDGRKYIKTAYGIGYQWIGGAKDETTSNVGP